MTAVVVACFLLCTVIWLRIVPAVDGLHCFEPPTIETRLSVLDSTDILMPILPTMTFLDKLNPEQREAVLHTDGPLLILAGAGSGKTRVITYRIAYLIGNGHAAPDEVLAVTFTNKAAGEMRERVESAARRRLPTASGSRRSTRLCARLLRREAPHIGLSRDFVIYDSSDQVAVVKQAQRELGIDDKLVPPRVALARISQAKNRMEGPDALRGALEPARRADRQDLRAIPHRARRTATRSTSTTCCSRRSSCSRPSAQTRERYAQQVQLRDGRRVPGHQPAAVPADQAAGRDPPQPRRRRRPRPVDLQVARRRPAQHPRLRARLPATPTSSASSRTTARRR